jgi:hypothetical protein
MRYPSFPELFELISFFEVEPAIPDQSVDWYYNHLVFTTVRRRDRVECQLEPSGNVGQTEMVSRPGGNA